MDKILKQQKRKPNDIVYTPLSVAKLMIKMCDIKETDKVLDPCKGGGIFYNNLPKCEKYWCEIDKKKDFFEWNKKVDLIIGNPPYSMWNKWLEHTIKYCDKFCYIFGVVNLDPKRIKYLNENGFYIKKMTFVRIDWWFLYSIIVLFEKDYNGDVIFENIGERILCDICNKRCGRGQTRKGVKQSPNICYLETLKKNKKK